MSSKDERRRFTVPKGSMLVLALTIMLLFVGLFVWHGDFRIPNASAVVTSSGLRAFWDSACTKNVTSISWGNVTPGSSYQRVIYVKNVAQSALILSMNAPASNWSPTSAALKIFLVWDSSGKKVQPGSVVKTVLKLYVSPTISGITDFNFLINIGVGFNKNPDINGDNVVNVADVTQMALAWRTQIGSARYKYECDLNNSGTVDIIDMTILALAF